MDRPYEISIELDTRSAKLDGTHPVKVRVYCKLRDSYEYKKIKRFNTDYSYSSEEWARIWTLKPRKEFLEKKKQLEDKISDYTKIADRIKPFNLQILAGRLGKGKRNIGGNSELFDLYETIKSELLRSDSIGTWQCYRDSQNCIERFSTSSGKGSLSFS